STARYKYGNKVLRCYTQHDRTVYPVNPTESEVESLPAFKSVLDCPDDVEAVSIITPPEVSYHVVQDCIKKGIKHIWFQPGAQNSDAIAMAEAEGINVIHDGSCILVVLGFRESA
ncbi:MAG: CoA-binding protein, partial [Calditrichaeota bacterium]|nr:CoA-binding protein [Calditrichota bacterium]